MEGLAGRDHGRLTMKLRRRGRIGGVCALIITLSACVPSRSLHESSGRIHFPSAGPASFFRALIVQSRDLGPARPDVQLSVLLLLKDPTRMKEAADLAAMYRPHSHTFGKFSTSARLAERYGPPAHDVARGRSVLHRYGLWSRWQPGNGWMVAGGTVRQIETTFFVRIHAYQSPTHVRFYASARDPTIPPNLRFLATGSDHISSYVPIQTQAVRPGGMTPSDLLQAYDIQELRKKGFNGEGQTVVFVEIDGFLQSTLDVFTSKLGLPRMVPTEIPQTSAKLGLTPLGETELDLEVVHEIAPRAKLVVYYFNQYNAEQAARGKGSVFGTQRAEVVDKAIREHRGSVISESFAICEPWFGSAAASVFERQYNAADLHGESVFASTGDLGAFECLDRSRLYGIPPAPRYISTSLPASAPGVTAVGGTRLDLAQDGSWLYETAWEEPARGQGTGGGISTFYARPAWQVAPGVDNQYNPSQSHPVPKRELPDVAADADPASGPAIYSTTNLDAWQQGGGTSQAAPIWAGITTLINQYLTSRGLGPVGFMNPSLYALARTPQAYPPFHDITLGSNLVYPATRGYDMATGLGTPDAWNLARDLERYLRNGRP